MKKMGPSLEGAVDRMLEEEEEARYIPSLLAFLAQKCKY
jgi:hypothetical protein